jgi:hypothetical protein
LCFVRVENRGKPAQHLFDEHHNWTSVILEKP